MRKITFHFNFMRFLKHTFQFILMESKFLFQKFVSTLNPLQNNDICFEFTQISFPLHWYLMSVRPRTYLITFLTYSTVHMMRMNYSFNKHQIQHTFELSSIFMGCLDALIFTALAVGTVFRYSIIKGSNYTLICLQTAIPTALSFSVVPILSLWHSANHGGDKQLEGSFFTNLVLVVVFWCFGFFQFAFFPVLLTLFSQHFDLKSEGSIIGFWSSKANAGNILGFLLSTLLVHQMGKKWENTMVICAILHIVLGLMCYFLLENVKISQEHQEDGNAITTQQFMAFSKQKWRQTEFKLYILSFSFFKAILYSYELWTPTFLTHQGYPHFSGYVPIVFDCSTLLGSYLMGRLYQETNSGNQLLVCIRRYKFVIASGFIVLASVLYVVLPANIVVYFMLGALMGLFLGAVYNALENNEILHYTKNQSRQTDLLSTLNIAIGSSMVAVFQLIIGFALHSNAKGETESGEDIEQQPLSHSNANSGRIYFVIMFLGIVAMVLSVLRSRYSKESPQEQGIQEPLEGVQMNEYH